MELDVTRYESGHGVAVITFDRPEHLNAWNRQLELEHRACLARAADDPAVRVIVLTGAGRAFSAGGDVANLEHMVERGEFDHDMFPPLSPDLGGGPGSGHPFAFQLAVPKPIIAAVNGAAAGGGLIAACYCDVRFAATSAVFTTSFARLGLPAEFATSWVLPRLVGAARAADLLLSSRVVPAQEAASMGLVSHVVPDEELLSTVLDYGRDIAANLSPASLAAIKRQLWSDLQVDLDTAMARSRSLVDEMVAGPDFAEGVAALTEKRRPNFTVGAVPA